MTDQTSPPKGGPFVTPPKRYQHPETALERAIKVHGPVQQPVEWGVHPACAKPPAHSGVCTYRFADGRYWCFKCEEAWER